MSKKIALKKVFAIVAAGLVLSVSSCKKDVTAPTNLSVTDITETTVKLMWTGTADSYEILLTSQSAADMPFSSTTNSCLLTNLTENTLYAWKIRAKKGSNYSDWVTGTSFTTAKGAIGAQEIIGIWEYEKVEIKELTCTDPLMDLMVRSILQEYGATEIISSYLNLDGTYEFTKEGKVISETAIGNNVSDYTINGKNLTISNFPQTINLSISNNKMYWDMDMMDFIKENFDDLLEMAKEMGIEITSLVVRVTFVKQ